MSITVFLKYSTKIFSHSQLSAPIKEHDSVDYFSQVNIKTISKQTFESILFFILQWLPTNWNAFDTSNRSV